MPRALLSVSDKRGIVDLGHGLVSRGFTLLSTGGTARALGAGGLAVTSVSDLTGVPEMLDGRVKTLHPAVHGGILARRDRPEDLAALVGQGIEPIDVVVVNLYPFEETARQPDIAFDELVEQIDIGGPSLVRAAAKNFRDVFVLVDPADYATLLDALDSSPPLAFRYGLARKAFAHTAAYDAAISSTLAAIDLEEDRFVRREGGQRFGERFDVSLEKIQDLRYGENPHQRAAWYAGREAMGTGSACGFGHATLLQGRELSYTNLLDLDAAVRFVLEFDEAAAAVIKHTNPCGVAIGVSPADAYVRARDTDRMASFGGIVALNREIDRDTAAAIVATKIDAVIAPSVDDAARATLARKGQMRVVTADFSGLTDRGLEFRSILGAVLAQDRDWIREARGVWAAAALPDGFRVVSQRMPSDEEWGSLRFAWRLCGHVKSNAIVFADAQRALAIGAGQMSRVDAVNVAVMKARDAQCPLAGSAAASDAFIPFRDGLDAIAGAGATAVVQPGGSLRDEEVIAAADHHGLAMVFTGRRHFRH
jgi:phosphoribosylaminoimidazolecarboxamide formyltransferase/IMP cyclohydrolase